MSNAAQCSCKHQFLPTFLYITEVLFKHIIFILNIKSARQTGSAIAG